MKHFKAIGLCLACLVTVVLLTNGCASTASTYKPTRSSLELQSIQTTEFEATYSMVFSSTLSVFQDLGFIILSADIQTGFITATSPKSQQFLLHKGSVTRGQMATAFVETLSSKKVRVRLNFINEEENGGYLGLNGKNTIPVEDATMYQHAFERIRKAVFIRESQL